MRETAAPTLAIAVELIRAVGDRAGLVSLGFMRRFDPGYAALKAQIQTALSAARCGSIAWAVASAPARGGPTS